MGAHSKRGAKAKRCRTGPQGCSLRGARSEENEEGSSKSSAPPSLPCLVKLGSQKWEEVEEGCLDVATFALKQDQHTGLLNHSVPHKLANVLFFFTEDDRAKGQQAQNGPLPGIGTWHVRAAASGALRNFVVNSNEDVVIDTLVSLRFTAASPQVNKEGTEVTFRDALVHLLASMWEYIRHAHQDLPPAVPLETAPSADGTVDCADSNPTVALHENETDWDANGGTFFAAMRTLEEVLQLVAVCVEGSEHIAEAFSAPIVVKALLSITEEATQKTWKALQMDEKLYEAAAPLKWCGSDNTVEDECKRKSIWLRRYRRRETELTSAIAVAASEVLHVLSGDNEPLASLMQSNEMVAAHEPFLTFALDADAVKTFLQEEVPSSPSSFPTSSFVAATDNSVAEVGLEENSALLTVSRHNILYQLCEVSLHLQGVLVNSSPVPANAARVLPLVVAVLNAHPPYNEWTRVVPLLLQSCSLYEELRVACLTRTQCRLRCVQAAVQVMHVVVDAVCSLNEASVEDEVAFQRNPEAALLYNSNAMYVVGELMRDALRLREPSVQSGTSSASLMTASALHGVGDTLGSREGYCENDVVVERALRAAAGTTGTGSLVTKLQHLVFSNEVGIWSLANTLLLMVPWTQLGDEPSTIWRAIIGALGKRSPQLMDGSGIMPLSPETENELGVQHCLLQLPYSQPGWPTECKSAKTEHLLRLQRESLLQMLWTLQRKQMVAAGGPLEVTNRLGACAGDIDLITRLAWETGATALHKQASVAVVCAACCSLRSQEAVTTATRFALGMLTADQSLRPDGSINGTSDFLPPGDSSLEHHRWFTRLVEADAQLRVLCEAANQLMDLFLDETHNDTVYVPLQVQSSLASFTQLFHTYSKRRRQQQREMMRNHKVVLPEFDEDGSLREVINNVTAFLEYKQQFLH
ncbi:hypothetical protein ERJ75_000419000 [Trypanosoma vivax]|uniref:Uncharacterized protein n=1 Tax=Trypanosoma vivax (strain Y486) TaxID=1055687 RepID=G0TZF9_TRYVY|nr:hypothetical protein ERJ75_000419000 [Trypanosoma vivax]CCC49362.1 conserved hypothetical protein [Trypanosoma vivax Y486]